MGRIVVSQFVTADGVIEAPGDDEPFEHAGWSGLFDSGPEGERFKLDELMAADALLLGRVTYQGFANAWPSMTDPAGFADKMNSMPKYVVSTTLDKAEWNNSTVISGDVEREVAALRQRHGGDILVNGSAQLVTTLRRDDLVDEYRLMVFPVVLGSGKRMFGDTGAATALRLVDTRPVGQEGVVILTYQPARAAEAQRSASA